MRSIGPFQQNGERCPAIREVRGAAGTARRPKKEKGRSSTNKSAKGRRVAGEGELTEPRLGERL